MPIITLNHLFEDIGFQSSLFKGGFLMSQEILQTHLGDTVDKPYSTRVLYSIRGHLGLNMTAGDVKYGSSEAEHSGYKEATTEQRCVSFQ